MQRRSYKIIRLLDSHNIDPLMGVEVGVQFGKNAGNLLKYFPKLQLILVDSYDETKVIHSKYTTAEVKQLCFDRLKQYMDRTAYILKLSVEAALEVDDRSVDYVFIDAEHTYGGVKEDIEAWLPKIKNGGLLLGHDFSARFRGVKRAAIERFKLKLQHIGDVWYVPVTEEIR